MRARPHTNARSAKRGCPQNNVYALSEYEGRVQNRYRFLTPKLGPFFAEFFYFGGVVSLARVLLSVLRGFVRRAAASSAQTLSLQPFSFNRRLSKAGFLSTSRCPGLVFFEPWFVYGSVSYNFGLPRVDFL